jgi:hypothetical protein
MTPLTICTLLLLATAAVIAFWLGRVKARHDRIMIALDDLEWELVSIRALPRENGERWNALAAHAEKFDEVVKLLNAERRRPLWRPW